MICCRLGRLAALASAGLALTAILSACHTMTPVTPAAPGATPRPTPTSPAPAPAPSERPYLADGPANLPGWAQEDHVAALVAYAEGCGVAREAAAVTACRRARLIQQTSRPINPDQARAFFETGFRAVPVHDGGRSALLTSYFSPEYPARHVADAQFDAPVLARPADLERDGVRVVQRRPDGSTGPYAERAAIEAAAAAGAPSAAVLAWMRAEDLFFLQIQGSGYLTFEDGTTTRAAYAADNGRPFVGIARPMADQGLLPRDGTSGDAIRAWLADHRGREARAVTALNPRYIFFQLQLDDGGQPAGAAGLPMIPRRSIAVDPSHWSYGDLVWLDADGASLPGARASYRGLALALDTGSAIRGPVRADLYMGRGEAAGSEAGSVRHPLRMWRLEPRP